MAQFEAGDLDAAKLYPLSASPLGAGEIYATVNDSRNELTPNSILDCNIAQFKHLVTVNIIHGNSDIFTVIDFITADIGTIVKAWFPGF